MSFLFKSKPKVPGELAKLLKDNLTKIDTISKSSSTDSLNKALEENSKIIGHIKIVLLGDDEHPFSNETSIQMCNEFYMNDLMYQMVSNLAGIEFETRKEVVSIMLGLIKKQIGSRFTTADFINSHLYILEFLFTSYEKGDISLNCGIILRECFKFDSLIESIFQQPVFWNIFGYVKIAEFHISSDAFATLKDLLTKNKSLSCSFITANYQQFLEQFNQLIESDNYILKRQSLKLLNELIADRACYDFMLQYVTSPSNLKLIMNCLRDNSKNIQFEAYHIFKIFAFNPDKPEAVASILYKNKEKLIEFLSTFSLEKAEDEEFALEKQSLIETIQNLNLLGDSVDKVASTTDTPADPQVNANENVSQAK